MIKYQKDPIKIKEHTIQAIKESANLEHLSSTEKEVVFKC